MGQAQDGLDDLRWQAFAAGRSATSGLAPRRRRDGFTEWVLPATAWLCSPLGTVQGHDRASSPTTPPRPRSRPSCRREPRTRRSTSRSTSSARVARRPRPHRTGHGEAQGEDNRGRRRRGDQCGRQEGGGRARLGPDTARSSAEPVRPTPDRYGVAPVTMPSLLESPYRAS